MTLVEYVLAVFGILVCGVSAITDIKYEKIKNSVIYPSAVLALIINIFCSIYTNLLGVFIINAVFMTIFSVVLYAVNFCGAGDSKLLIFIIFCIPPSFYINRLGGNFQSVSILMFIFVPCIIYIVAESIVLTFIWKNKSNYSRKMSIKQYLAAYVNGVVIITSLSQIEYFALRDFYANNQYAVILFNFIATIILLQKPTVRKPYVVIPLIAVELTVTAFTSYKNRFVNMDYKFILLFFVMLLLKKYIERFNYRTIKSDDVCEGMILSTPSSMLILQSQIDGLTKLSKENLNSKLTHKEAESIKEWGKSKDGQSEITIVRKMPFGLFIAFGTIIFIIESVLIKI